jgi:hypothetical protein
MTAAHNGIDNLKREVGRDVREFLPCAEEIRVAIDELTRCRLLIGPLKKFTDLLLDLPRFGFDVGKLVLYAHGKFLPAGAAYRHGKGEFVELRGSLGGVSAHYYKLQEDTFVDLMDILRDCVDRLGIFGWACCVLHRIAPHLPNPGSLIHEARNRARHGKHQPPGGTDWERAMRDLFKKRVLPFEKQELSGSRPPFQRQGGSRVTGRG